MHTQLGSQLRFTEMACCMYASWVANCALEKVACGMYTQLGSQLRFTESGLWYVCQLGSQLRFTKSDLLSSTKATSPADYEK